jgi:hypothetical protein
MFRFFWRNWAFTKFVIEKIIYIVEKAF